MKLLLILVSSLALTGCASNGIAQASTASNSQSIRDSQGVTQYRIRDGAVLTPSGVRVARIDSRGNIYSTQGATAGRRIAQIK